MRRVNLQQAVERGVARGARSAFLFAGFPPLGNTGKLSKLEEYDLEQEDIEEVFKSTASSWQLERFTEQREIDLKEFTRLRDGLVLVTGPTGNGKATTLAALIDIISRERSCHTITVKDPIEYLFRPHQSVISQRET